MTKSMIDGKLSELINDPKPFRSKREQGLMAALVWLTGGRSEGDLGAEAYGKMLDKRTGQYDEFDKGLMDALFAVAKNGGVENG